tara:strand:+ start:2660 stop:3388 length:729 start_codon:yes stop_codon:yes gene_type:complete
VSEIVREIVFDTETTGLSPDEGHRLVELGCVELINKIRTGKTYHVYINPQRDMPYEAFKVHGLNDEFLSDKPIFSEVANDFISFLDLENQKYQTKLIIHNAAFDMKFTNFELNKVKIPSISNNYVIDTLKIAREKFPGQKNNLDALCNRFDISLASREKHGALLDAELLAEVYIELCGGKQSSLLFDVESKEEVKEVNKNAINKKAVFSDKKYIEPRNYELSQQELKAHEEFLKENINESIW